MKYFPFENITYQTKLEPKEILEKINEVIEPKKTFRSTGIFGSSDHKPYEGSINENSFSITRIIGYRNSFLPRINGVVEKGFNGTKIRVKMKLHILVIVFMFIWFGGVGIACLALLPMMFNNQDFESMTLIPFGNAHIWICFGYMRI